MLVLLQSATILEHRLRVEVALPQLADTLAAMKKSGWRSSKDLTGIQGNRGRDRNKTKHCISRYAQIDLVFASSRRVKCQSLDTTHFKDLSTKASCATS
jgi:hypothetical protein